jgi:hypothetical protein
VSLNKKQMPPMGNNCPFGGINMALCQQPLALEYSPKLRCLYMEKDYGKFLYFLEGKIKCQNVLGKYL